MKRLVLNKNVTTTVRGSEDKIGSRDFG